MNLVLGYIDTPEGNAALERAIEESRLRNAHLIVIHSAKSDRDRTADDVAVERDHLTAVSDRLAAEGVPHTVRDLVRGRTATADIVTEARESEAALIIIGLRRRSPTGKFLLGSNAQDILLEAPCPVLAVHSDEIP